MKKIKYKDPSIRLINEYDSKKEAWMISRPHLSHNKIYEEMDKIENMDLSINGFASYVFHVNSSILFRDLLFSLRPIVVWAKSNRTTRLDRHNMMLSGEYNSSKRDRLLDESQLVEVFELVGSGLQQDLVKNLLPMSCNTEFTISIDDRTLITFIKLLRIHSKSLYNIYGVKFLLAIGKVDDYVDARHTADIFNKLSVSDIEYDNIGNRFITMDSMASVHRVSSNLMAQFIRQHYSTVKNELFNIIDKSDILDIYLRCNSDIVVALYANRHSFDKLISIRTCWFAQFDREDNSSWAYILKPFVDGMTAKEFVEQLPCKGCPCDCQIIGDMIPRVNLDENILPCALLLEDGNLIDERASLYMSTSSVFNKWVDARSSGLISDNPNNRLRKQYEENLLK